VHVPDGWIDLPTSAAAGVVALAATAVAGRKAAVAWRDKSTTLPAVVAAYLLVGQLLVLPVGFGTSAHLIGTGLAALLVGPEIAIMCVAIVVVVQAVVLADGGITALGINLIDDGIVPAVVAATFFAACRPFLRRCSDLGSHRAAAIAAGASAALASLAAAGSAALFFVVGGTDVVPARTVATAIGAGHLVIAVLEGVLTALAVASILRLRPDLVRAYRRPVGDLAEPTSGISPCERTPHDEPVP